MKTFKQFLSEAPKPISSDQLVRTMTNFVKKTYLSPDTYEKYGKDEFTVDTYAEWVELKIYSVFKADVSAHRVMFHMYASVLDAFQSKHREDNEEKQIELFDLFLNKLGWCISSHTFGAGRVTVKVEPLAGIPLKQIPAKMYHFSPIWNKDSILRKGIIPNKSDRPSYRYPSRVFLLKTFDKSDVDGLSFAIANYDTSSEDYYNGNADITPVVVFEVDTSKLRPGTKIYQDIDHPSGAWSKTHIPPEALKVVYDDSENPYFQDK